MYAWFRRKAIVGGLKQASALGVGLTPFHAQKRQGSNGTLSSRASSAGSSAWECVGAHHKRLGTAVHVPHLDGLDDIQRQGFQDLI